MKTKITFKSLLVITCLLLQFNLQAKIHYVKIDGIGDGSSWTNASGNIQDMIDKAEAGDEVWVAKGTYYPMVETEARNPRSKTFLLKSGVHLYGGFAGNETDIEQRATHDKNKNNTIEAWEFTNEVVLSGNIDGVEDVWTNVEDEDGTWSWTVTGNESNCYHVVSHTTSSNNKETKIDGLSIVGGNADGAVGNGGGIYASASYSSVSNCTVYNNSAKSNGGGIYVYASSSSPSPVSNCTVYNNSAGNNGGGIYAYAYAHASNSSSSSPVSNCTVYDNSAGSNGGGIYADASSYSSADFNYSSSPVSNCTVYNNSAGNNGGGIYVGASSYCSSFSVKNCIVYNNSAGNNGGGIYTYATYTYTYASASSAASNCTVYNNSAGNNGGGIYANAYAYAYTSVRNCAVHNNKKSNIAGNGFTENNSSIAGDLVNFLNPTNFVGCAVTESQISDLSNANWRLKENSRLKSIGTSSSTTATDIEGNPSIQYGGGCIGAYSYTPPTMKLPFNEDFNSCADFGESRYFWNNYGLKWIIKEGKAVFDYENNPNRTNYSELLFSYRLDATQRNDIVLKYDINFVSYKNSGNSTLEQLAVEISTNNGNTWKTIQSFTNQNGDITIQKQTHDITIEVQGKVFYIRFRAFGKNSNNIEKWEIDNIIVKSSGDPDPTVIKTISKDIASIRSISNGIYIDTKEAASIVVYNLSGQIVYQNVINGSTEITLDKGVYIVRVNNESQKVIVK